MIISLVIQSINTVIHIYMHASHAYMCSHSGRGRGPGSGQTTPFKMMDDN
jgi:hypothetical protein